MSSIVPIRDPKTDHLITPENSALILIDYQPLQVNSIKSMDHEELVKNIVTVSKLARGFNIPVVLSTVNVESGINKPTIKQLKDVLSDVDEIDRTTVNSWEDQEFQDALKKLGKKKLIVCALWTEVCLCFPALDLIKEGYEVYTIVDAVGGTSKIAHETALRRMEQAGVQLSSVTQFACELQRDWNRLDTKPLFFESLMENGSFFVETLRW
ncbi:hydrolase [Elizabethkingia miricola]|uniref:Hydrolase n=1 Tax=Elizabethkingia miricola TaxID=172045 RepID=A0ABD4DK51_ELIMR|nr:MULTISPECIES: hydrolase [Elizabethkingia]KUG12681.1 amidase [Elizabethkingia miricola]KUY17511.1 hydrolase [Elizabethkingia miricola]MCL1652720.1 hydrolase [Elizabethkingia miricola]MCL1657327.1 hydrolase [Elizabethkingia miricola]MCL1680163.1 hydrolase [Elizabethkingia miricola]